MYLFLWIYLLIFALLPFRLLGTYRWILMPLYDQVFLMKVSFASFSYTYLAKLKNACSKHWLEANVRFRIGKMSKWSSEQHSLETAVNVQTKESRVLSFFQFILCQQECICLPTCSHTSHLLEPSIWPEMLKPSVVLGSRNVLSSLQNPTYVTEEKKSSDFLTLKKYFSKLCYCLICLKPQTKKTSP